MTHRLNGRLIRVETGMKTMMPYKHTPEERRTRIRELISRGGVPDDELDAVYKHIFTMSPLASLEWLKATYSWNQN